MGTPAHCTYRGGRESRKPLKRFYVHSRSTEDGAGTQGGNAPGVMEGNRQYRVKGNIEK